jgi:hypothetical protein
MSLAGIGDFIHWYADVFTVVVLAGTLAIAVGLWRNDWRCDGYPVLFSAMMFLALFTLGPGYGSQYWFWIVPLILVCYRNFGGGFRRIIWISMSIVVATNIFEYAVELDLGRFLFNGSPSSSLQYLSDYFTYPSRHLIWLRLPMTLSASLLLFSGVALLMRRNPPVRGQR